jgi:predicted PurR-regulated permease PerM
MLTVVNVLIVFFIILVSYQIILANHIVEGLENKDKNYKPYPPNALILAQQNAGNIEFLKHKIDDLQNINTIVNDLSGNVQSLQQQVNGLVSAQQQFATQMVGDTPPQITGATDDSSQPVDTSDLVTE